MPSPFDFLSGGDVSNLFGDFTNSFDPSSLGDIFSSPDIFSGIGDAFGNVGSDLGNLFGADSPLNLLTSGPGTLIDQSGLPGLNNNTGPLMTPNGTYTPQAPGPLNLQTITDPLKGLIAGSGGTGGPALPGNTPGTTLTTPPANTYTPGGLINPQTGLPVGPQASSPFNMQNLISALSGAGLLAGLTKGNDLGPDAGALRGLAKGNMDLVNNQLMPTALANQQGMINAPALNAIERRLRESEAGMREKYAQMGASGSTMEQEDLADLRQKAQDEVFATGQEMATSGLQTAAQLTGQSSSVYEALMQAQVQQDEELAKAIAAFAGAAAR